VPAKKNTKRKKAVGRPATGKRVVPKTITLELSDVEALGHLATKAQTFYIMREGQQNPNIGSSWVIRSLIRNAQRALDGYILGVDHPAPAEFFGISGDVEAAESSQD
jgi:hypothetical protein